MNTSAKDAYGWIVSSGVGAAAGALLSALIGSWFQHRQRRDLEKFKSDLSVVAQQNVEIFKSTIAARTKRVEDQLQTRFSWVYEERAKAMSEIYSSLVDVFDALQEFHMSFGDLGGQGTPSERASTFRAGGNKFRIIYRPQRMLFPENVADQLDRLNRAFVAAYNSFLIQLKTNPDEYSAFERYSEETLNGVISTTEEAMKSLTKSFRDLYGTEHDDPRAGRPE